MNLLSTTEVVDINAIKSIIYATCGVYAIYIILLYWIGQKQLNKGVDIE